MWWYLDVLRVRKPLSLVERLHGNTQKGIVSAMSMFTGRNNQAGGLDVLSVYSQIKY